MIEIKIDDVVVLAISDLEEKIVNDSMPSFKDWIAEGVPNNITSKIESSYRLMARKYPEIFNTLLSVEEKAASVFSQPDYKDYATLVAEQEAERLAKIAAAAEAAAAAKAEAEAERAAEIAAAVAAALAAAKEAE